MKRFFVTLIFFLFFFLPRPIEAKDYRILSADFVVHLQADGAAQITETRTYRFDGSFSWADEWINLVAPREIKDLVITENNQPIKFESRREVDRFYVKWFYTADTEDKTFVINYKITNAITRQQDIAEFYWQLIGDKWTKQTGKVSAKVFLPAPAPNDQIWAFGE